MMNLYVSKLGDNSDGSGWAKAFHTIQQALLAVPDAQGGHRVLVRPDRYFEANLYPAHRGAEGAYNQLIGDGDGRLGSGATGWVIIDSGDQARGFKSYDFWSTFRAYTKGWSPAHTEPTVSAVDWDRWAFHQLYATGSDGAFFFDGTDHVEPFSIVVEDCVGIGRAFGGGVGNVLSRGNEPITFRRCHLWSLDFLGDTAAAYVRIENQRMPDQPDAVFEDCVLVSPQAALKSTNYGLTPYTWTSLKRCHLINLNFTQPGMMGPEHGSPPEGIVISVQRGDRMQVSFEDCGLVGYKVFGVMVEKQTARDIQYSTHGDCWAYLQFKSEVPEGFRCRGDWPVELFQNLMPAAPTGR